MPYKRISKRIFKNLCITVNPTHSRHITSSTATLESKFDAWNAAVMDRNRRVPARNAVNTAIIQMAAAKRTKYQLALDYVRFCINQRVVSNFNRNVTAGRFTVSVGGQVGLLFQRGQEGPPADCLNRTNLRNNDGGYAVELATAGVRAARGCLYSGAYNNKMNIRGTWKYITDDSPKYLYQKNEAIQNSLAPELLGGGDEPNNLAKQMSAMAYGPLITGGGVCAQISHFTAGLLTMMAKPGTHLAIVFDSGFNHSFVVIRYGQSPWVVVDPWPGEARVPAWAHGYFPRGNNILNHFSIEIRCPVPTPYGHTFSAEALRSAKRAADAVRPYRSRTGRHLGPGGTPMEMDANYGHRDNTAERYRQRYQIAAGPGDWGAAVQDF